MNRFLRNLNVGSRIVGGFFALVALLALALPLIVLDHNLLVGRLARVSDVASADRLLLLASVRVASSRVNLMRYLYDYLPSAQDSLNDADQAAKYMAQAQGLTSSEQKASVEATLQALASYRTLISDIDAARRKGETQEADRLVFLAYKTGSDIEQQVEQIVQVSEASVQDANAKANVEARNRLLAVAGGYTIALVLSMVMATLVARSITQPLHELRSGAEAFRHGQLDAQIPAAGADELSLLASTFNQMVAQLARSYQELEKRVADRTAELERQKRYMEATTSIARDAASALSLQELLSRTVNLISQRLGFYHTGLYLLDHAGESVEIRAASSEGGQRLLARQQRLQVGKEGIIGAVAAQGQYRLALDTSQDTVFLNVPELPETRSELALPLQARGEIIGVLDVQSRERAAFTPEDITTLQTLADQIALAISNTLLIEKVQTSLEAERRAYGELSRKAWQQLLQAQTALGYACDAANTIRPAIHDWQSEAPQLAQGQTVRLQQGILAVPIRVREQTIGAIKLCKTTGEWTAEEIALTQTMTEQLSLALESARLYQDTQRRAAQEKLTGEAATRMRESLDMDVVLQTAVQQFGEIFELPKVEIYLAAQEPDNGQSEKRSPDATIEQ